MSSGRPVLTFAREDFRDTFRERQGYVVIGILVLFSGVSTVNYGRATSPHGEPIVHELAPQLFPILNMFVPLVAVGLFSAAIVQKRESGSLKVMLGLPIQRRDVILGTFLARSALVTVAVVAALAVAVVIGSVTSVSVNVGEVIGAVLLLSLVGIVFTSFAVAISVYVRSAAQAILTGFVIWAFFAFQYWGHIPLSVLYVRHGFSYPADIPGWVDAILALNPLAAYAYLVEGLFPALDGGTFFNPPGSVGILEEPAVSFAVIVIWIILGLVLAIRRFRRAEL